MYKPRMFWQCSHVRKWICQERKYRLGLLCSAFRNFKHIDEKPTEIWVYCFYFFLASGASCGVRRHGCGATCYILTGLVSYNTFECVTVQAIVRICCVEITALCKITHSIPASAKKKKKKIYKKAITNRRSSFLLSHIYKTPNTM